MCRIYKKFKCFRNNKRTKARSKKKKINNILHHVVLNLEIGQHLLINNNSYPRKYTRGFKIIYIS